MCEIREKIWYIFCGILTTAVNYIAYYILVEFLSWNYLNATMIAWLAAVLFSYAVNKKYVFESQSTGLDKLLSEMVAYILSRLLSGLLELFQMFLFVSSFGWNDKISKVLVGVIVVVVNYIFAKRILER